MKKLIPPKWNAVNIGDQSGKKFLITGATSGIGKETARQLLLNGAEVIITARDKTKGEATLAQLEMPRLSYEILELTDLRSVTKLAQRIDYDIDTLILNAGVMAIPQLTTVDGFEGQFAANHLGHFALAGLLRTKIKSRIVSLSSQAHRMGSFGKNSKGEIRAIALGEGADKPWGSYGASKLANLLFINELQRLSIKNNWGITAVAAHPGLSHTNLSMVAPQMRKAKIEGRVTAAFMSIFAQSAERGALPTLCAATFASLPGAAFIGPNGFLELQGDPQITRGSSKSQNSELAKCLWAVSEELTGVAWK